MRQLVTLELVLMGMFSLLGCVTPQVTPRKPHQPVQTMALREPRTGLVQPQTFISPAIEDWKSWFHCGDRQPTVEVTKDMRFITILVNVMMLSFAKDGKIPTARGLVNAVIENQREIAQRLHTIFAITIANPPTLRPLTPEEERARPKESLTGKYAPGYPLSVVPTEVEGEEIQSPFLVVIHPHGIDAFCLWAGHGREQVAWNE